MRTQRLATILVKSVTRLAREKLLSYPPDRQEHTELPGVHRSNWPSTADLAPLQVTVTGLKSPSTTIRNKRSEKKGDGSIGKGLKQGIAPVLVKLDVQFGRHIVR